MVTSLSQHGLQDTLESRGEGLKPSIEALKAQIFAATVPRQLENVKELLLSIVHILSPGRAAKEVFLFVNRIVDLSMNILILLEAKEDMPNIQIESLHQALEDVKTFVVSTNRWKSYPFSVDTVRKVTSARSRVLEQRILSIRDGLETSFANAQNETPTRELSNEICNDISSNLFSNASNFTVNKSHVYSISGGSVQFVANHVENNQSTGHPDFLGLPFYDDLELEMELCQSKEYRLHRGRTSGRAVVVKVYEGPRAKQISLKTAKFFRSLMHSNVLRLIGGPDRNSGTSLLVFDGDYHGTVEPQLATALKAGIKEGCVVGANTIVACSLGLDYLQKLGLPFPIMCPEDFILLVSKQGRIVISFDADISWEANSHDRCDQSAVVQSDKATKICHELIQKTFYTSCKEYYQGQRLYADVDGETDQTDDDEFDKAKDENVQWSPGPNHGDLDRGSTSRKSQQKAKGHRRELVWKPHSTTLLSEVGRRYQASLARFRSQDVLAYRRVHYMTPTAHRCPGYQRTEIILTPDIERSNIVSHTSPVPNEICSVCGEKVGTRELFDCLCGVLDNDKANVLPTIKCTVCSHWQHQQCMNITTNTQLKSYRCWRCARSSIAMVSPRIPVTRPVLQPSFDIPGSSIQDFGLVSPSNFTQNPAIKGMRARQYPMPNASPPVRYEELQEQKDDVDLGGNELGMRELHQQQQDSLYQQQHNDWNAGGAPRTDLGGLPVSAGYDSVGGPSSPASAYFPSPFANDRTMWMQPTAEAHFANSEDNKSTFQDRPHPPPPEPQVSKPVQASHGNKFGKFSLKQTSKWDLSMFGGDKSHPAPPVDERSLAFNFSSVEQKVPDAALDSFDDLNTVSLTTFGLESSDHAVAPTHSRNGPLISGSSTVVSSSTTAAPSTSRQIRVTGIGNGITPDSLLDEHAPTRLRTYITPAATSRKEIPGMFERKRSRSTAFGDVEDEVDELDDILPPNSPERALIEQKRRQNTIAARRSRKRKLEQSQMLEKSLRDARITEEIWKERVNVMSQILKAHHVPIPDWSADE